MSNTILVYFLKMYGNKKGMGFSILLIPAFRPSHCLYVRISNADSPRQVIINTTICYTLYNI